MSNVIPINEKFASKLPVLGTKYRISNMDYIWDMTDDNPYNEMRLKWFHSLERPWRLVCPDGTFFMFSKFEEAIEKMNQELAKSA